MDGEDEKFKFLLAVDTWNNAHILDWPVQLEDWRNGDTDAEQVGVANIPAEPGVYCCHVDQWDGNEVDGGHFPISTVIKLVRLQDR